MMIIKQLEVGYMDNFCYIVGCEDTHHWEKRNNVNAREYVYHED